MTLNDLTRMEGQILRKLWRVDQLVYLFSTPEGWI